MPSERFDFPNARGEKLAALLDLPAGQPRAFALFAHCFTCGKDNWRPSASPRRSPRAASRCCASTSPGSARARASSPTRLSRPTSTTWSRPPNHLRKKHQRARDPDRPQPRRRRGAGGGAAQVPEARAVVTIAACADPEPRHRTVRAAHSRRSARRARSRSRSPAGRSASAGNFWTTSPSRSSSRHRASCARRC